MKRKLIAAVIGLLLFLGGFFTAIYLSEISRRDMAEYAQRQHAEQIKRLHESIYGDNYLHWPGVDREAEQKLADLDFSRSQASISLRVTNGLSRYDGQWTIRGDGSTLYAVKEDKEIRAAIDPLKCGQWFREVLTSGILNYSDGAVEIKKELSSGPKMIVSDASHYELHIKVPELEIDKLIKVYAPEFELENFPDIIEFKLFTQVIEQIDQMVEDGD